MTSPNTTFPNANNPDGTPVRHSKPKYAKGPKIQRGHVHGVLLLDKPLGQSSNDALGRAKWLLKALKAGHTGTLDPLATGLLPLCFGEATKFSQDLLHADKEYLAEIFLGVTTTSGDVEGEVIRTQEVTCTESDIERVAIQFRGDILQIPPMYSALKRDGKPLYEYARAGQTVEREARAVTIHALEIVNVQLPKVTIRVLCSKGTYIRTLAEDIGNALGCGAHLTALRRSQVGDLRIENAITLKDLEDTPESERTLRLAPVDALLQQLQQVTLDEDNSRRFGHGQRVPLVSALMAGLTRVYGGQGELLGVANYQNGVLHPERLMRFENP